MKPTEMTVEEAEQRLEEFKQKLVELMEYYDIELEEDWDEDNNMYYFRLIGTQEKFHIRYIP